MNNIKKYTVYITKPDGSRFVKLDAEHGKCNAADCSNQTRRNALVCESCWFDGWEGELVFTPDRVHA